MSRPLFLFRPEPGWSDSAAHARKEGLDVRGHPLFAIEALEWECPDPAGYDGLLVGSANVFRHGGANLERLQSLPVHAVGASTAQAARAAGFSVAETGRGGLQVLVDRLDPPVHMLRLAGEAHVPLDLPAGVTSDARILYRSRALPLEARTLEDLAEGGVVALHSGEAARHFDAAAGQGGIDREKLEILALGPRIAAMAGSGWRAIHIAEAAEEGALLAKARQMCHTP